MLRTVAPPEEPSSFEQPPVRPAAEDMPNARPSYRLSVIPGGAYSIEELALARQNDPVVNAHYAVFDASRLHMTEAPASALVYVSYRIANNIYWTRHRVRLAAGETLLTDGEHVARARCGNRVAETPQQPVRADDTWEAVLDQWRLPPSAESMWPTALVVEMFPPLPPRPAAPPAAVKTGTRPLQPSSPASTASPAITGRGLLWMPWVGGLSVFSSVAPSSPESQKPPVEPAPFVPGPPPPVTPSPILLPGPVVISPLSPSPPSTPEIENLPINSYYPPVPLFPQIPFTPVFPFFPPPDTQSSGPQPPETWNTPLSPGPPSFPTPPQFGAPPAPVPEPEAFLLLAAGILLMLVPAIRRRP